ncbi:MAG: 16S rRNA processing protein RimM [Bacteroidaceae bacterium]|nr:16S rRNA processing protein RimM [Bacteroidaceae bacterium]
MIRKEDVYRIGLLTKPHGIKGEVAFSFTDDIFDRTDECDYLVCLMDGIMVPFFMEEYRFKSDTVALVKFEGVDTAEQARRFTNIEVYYPTRYAEESDELSWSYFVGFRIEDEQLGLLGEVEEIDETTINTLFIVRRPNGEELLIPAQEAFITDMDHKQRIIRMDLPEGMVE